MRCHRLALVVLQKKRHPQPLIECERGVKMGHVQVSNLIPASRDDVFKYALDLQKLIADLEPGIELSIALVDGTTLPEVKVNAEIPMAVRRLGITAHGLVRIEKVNAPVELSYCQDAGWFRNWRHTIKLEEHREGKTPSTLMSDLIDYRLPFGVLGTLTDDLFFNRNLSQILSDRAARIRAHFEAIPTTQHGLESGL